MVEIPWIRVQGLFSLDIQKRNKESTLLTFQFFIYKASNVIHIPLSFHFPSAKSLKLHPISIQVINLLMWLIYSSNGFVLYLSNEPSNEPWKSKKTFNAVKRMRKRTTGWCASAFFAVSSSVLRSVKLINIYELAKGCWIITSLLLIVFCLMHFHSFYAISFIRKLQNKARSRENLQETSLNFRKLSKRWEFFNARSFRHVFAVKRWFLVKTFILTRSCLPIWTQNRIELKAELKTIRIWMLIESFEVKLIKNF